MKKVLLIISSIVLLSGCTISYNLDINTSNLSETITTNITQSDYSNYLDSKEDKPNTELYTLLSKNDIWAFNNNKNDIHQKSITKGNFGYDVTYKYTYYYSNFVNSYIINNCFDRYDIYNKDDYYYIKLSGKFNCYYGDTNINITTKNLVYNNNANSINEDTYSWIINDSNKDDVNITFQLSKTELKANQSNNENSDYKNPYTIYIVISIVIIVAIGSGILIYKKLRINN